MHASLSSNFAVALAAMTAAAAFAQVPADFREDPAKYWNLAELEKAPAARLCYTRSRNANTRLRPWEECPAEVQLGHVYGRLPPDVVQCYLSVEDEEDAVYGSCRTTTPFVTVDDAPPRHVRVAASDSSVTDRRSADFVCTGRNDEETVNRALALLARGGTVQLLDGNCFFDSFGQEGNSMVCAGSNDGVARTLNLVGTTENKSYNTSFGAVIHVTERAMKAIDPAKGEHRVFFGTARKPEARPDWFTYTHVNNMNLENFYLKFHDASRPPIGIDCRNFGSTYMRLVGVYTEHLPSKARKVTELISGRIVATDARDFAYAFEGPDTRIFMMER